MASTIEIADVAVLGAGLFGVSAALHAAEAGAEVVLVDPLGVGAGASFREVAYLAHPYDPAQVELFDSSLQLMRDAGVPMPLHPVGTLVLSLDRGAAATVHDAMSAAHSELRPRLLDPASLQSIEPEVAPGAWACLLDTGYPLCPRQATEAFLRAAEDAGAITVRARNPALLWDGRRCGGLSWEGGQVSAPRVIVAAGAGTSTFVEPNGSWTPVNAQWGVDVVVGHGPSPRRVLVEASLAGAQQKRGSGGRLETGFSFVAGERRSILGSTFLANEPEPREWLPRLLEGGRQFLPALAESAVEDVTACPRPQSTDGRPLLGHVAGADGLLVASGAGSRGISIGVSCGRLVAAAALAGSDGRIPVEVRAERFPLTTG